MNKVDCAETTSGGYEFVIAGAETPFRHTGSEVSLWYILLEYKGKPFAPDSWVKTFDLDCIPSQHHQYFHFHQYFRSSALIDGSRVALPISIQSYCPLVSITCHRQTHINTLAAFRHQSHRQDEKGKKRPEQSKDRASTGVELTRATTTTTKTRTRTLFLSRPDTSLILFGHDIATIAVGVRQTPTQNPRDGRIEPVPYLPPPPVCAHPYNPVLYHHRLALVLQYSLAGANLQGYLVTFQPLS